MPSTPTKGAHAKSDANHCWKLGYSGLLCAKENKGERVMAKGVEKMYQTNKKIKKEISKGKSFWDIIVELKGTNKRKSFYEWLTNG